MNYLFETNRLGIRELTINDEIPLQRIICNDEVMQFFGGGWSKVANHAGLLKQLEHYRTFGFGRWAVEIKDTRQFIGICGPQWWKDINGQCLELGYFFNNDFWGHGFASEAAKGCIDYCFENLNISELCSIIEARNLPSMNLAIRSGMLAKELYQRGNHWHYKFSIKNSKL